MLPATVHPASGVTVRAAIKPLADPIKAALLAGYRDKIPIRWEHEDTEHDETEHDATEHDELGTTG